MEQQHHKKKRDYFACTLFLIIISVVASFNGKLYTYIKINAVEKQRFGDRIECALQHEADPTKVDFTAFYRLYSNLQNFVYLEIYNQPLDVFRNGRKHFDSFTNELSENPERVDCLQISKNVVEKYQLRIETGRIWDDAEYIIEDHHIPVILGNGYSGIYEIGDIFEAEYLYESYVFSVIGFFEKNSVIYTGRYGFINLDQSIVMPSFNVQEGAVPTDSLKIHYANKTSGIIELSRDFYLNDYRELEEKLNSSGCGNYSLSLSPLYAHFRNSYGVSIFTVFCLLIVLWIICGAIIVYLFHIFKNKYSLTVNRYIWVCFVPILLFFLLEGKIANIQQYRINIMYILGTEGILVITHILAEVLFQKITRKNKI